jgi:hypothetical protein
MRLHGIHLESIEGQSLCVDLICCQALPPDITVVQKSDRSVAMHLSLMQETSTHASGF